MRLALGGKNQIPKPHLVIMTSKCNIRNSDTKLSEPARNALISRMMVYEVCDDQFDPSLKDARQNQLHRKPDFSHVRFWNDGEDLTIDELADAICEKLGSSLDTYKLLCHDPIGSNPKMCNGKPLSIDKTFSADNTEFLHWFAGNPGTGKSRSIWPHIRELTSMIKVGYHAPSSLYDLQAITTTIGDVFVIDDLFDLSSKTHHLLFIQWYTSLPSMCKVVALSKYGPDSMTIFLTVYSFKKNYKPLDVSKLKPAVPRRLGFTISDEARCVIKTNGG